MHGLNFLGFLFLFSSLPANPISTIPVTVNEVKRFSRLTFTGSDRPDAESPSSNRCSIRRMAWPSKYPKLLEMGWMLNYLCPNILFTFIVAVLFKSDDIDI